MLTTPSSTKVRNGLELYLCLPFVSVSASHGITFTFYLYKWLDISSLTGKPLGFQE